MKKWIIAFAVFGLTACANVPEQRGQAIAEQPATAITSLPKSGLGPQSLAPGECGLFLWSQTDINTFIFFSRAATGTALFAQDAKPIELTQTAADGDIFGQFQTQLGYSANSGEQYALTITPGEDMQGGQRIESGLFTITDLEGWQTKLPVLGLRACQPD